MWKNLNTFKSDLAAVEERKDEFFMDNEELSSDGDNDESDDGLEDLIDLFPAKDKPMPLLNKIHEIVNCAEFAKKAENFMQVVGEDSIFRSGPNWMSAKALLNQVNPALSIEQAKQRAKKKMVREAVDSILM